jgi:D-psicose/D-tagatose/L-ribulose 3-epimerase
MVVFGKMVKFGVTSWVWVYPFDHKVIEKAKEIGSDGIEIPIENPKKINVRATKEALKSHEIECSSLCAVLGPDRDLISADKAVRENAKKYLKACVDFATEFNADMVCGPLYSCVGKTKFMRDKEREWKYAVMGLREVGKYAEDGNVFLGLEPINRYETRLVNLVSDCLRMLKEIDSPAVKLHFDTYHGNIEEKSLGQAIRAGGSLLYHVHACENDRGTPGSGHIGWKEVAQALKDVGYNRYMVIETFQPGTKEIATAASIWRKLAPSQDELAREGLLFLRELMK